MAIFTLLHECQSSCSPDAACTKPSRCTDDTCRTSTFKLVQEHADCGSDDTKLGVFSDKKACADECAASADEHGVQCEAFAFGRDDAGSIDPQYADRKGMCWFEHTAVAHCPEGLVTTGSSVAYDYYQLVKDVPPSPPLPPWPSSPPPSPPQQPDDGLSYGGLFYGVDEPPASPSPPSLPPPLPFERIRTGAECDDGAGIKLWDVPDGEDDTRQLEACAHLCELKSGCKYFIYGVGSKRGQCWQEETKDGCETAKWEPDDYDFYTLLDYSPPPLPPFAPGLAPLPPPPASPPPPPQLWLDAMREKGKAFLAGGITGGVSAFAMVIAAACVVGLMYRAWLKKTKEERLGLNDRRGDTELAEAASSPL